MNNRGQPRPIVPTEVLKELRSSVQDRSRYVLGRGLLQWFATKISIFGLWEARVDTMSYRRTKICFVLSWDVLVSMLPMRPGRSNSLWNKLSGFYPFNSVQIRH